MSEVKTFSIIFSAEPLESNPQYELVKSAIVHCLFQDYEPEPAFRSAVFEVQKHEWEIVETIQEPKEVTRDYFADQDIGLESFDKAQQHGHSLVFAGVARDGKTELGPQPLRVSKSTKIEKFLKSLKQHRRRGRCLHFDSGGRCNKIIHAHSIQNNQMLSSIARDGHVYTLAKDFSEIIKNQGRVNYTLKGVNQTSTFLGFCAEHDNQLFQPIDHQPLLPNAQQAMLYAYRSLCREIFVKENAVEVYKDSLDQQELTAPLHDLLKNAKRGTENGLQNLRIHKSRFDESLKSSNEQDICYTVFHSDRRPNIAVSGVVYPDFDFLGRPIQNLADLNTRLELITICSAPLADGWGLILAWHKFSSHICLPYLHSIVAALDKGQAIEDMLFRVVINFENIAISPDWWESLKQEYRDLIVRKQTESIDPHAGIHSNYLAEGYEGISEWKFQKVSSNLGFTI